MLLLDDCQNLCGCLVASFLSCYFNSLKQMLFLVPGPVLSEIVVLFLAYLQLRFYPAMDIWKGFFIPCFLAALFRLPLFLFQPRWYSTRDLYICSLLSLDPHDQFGGEADMP
jgi:hypothetical protein